MALEHAILISLREQAGSGYELARRFERSIGFFWGASHQQIYRTLNRMHASGWVTSEVVPQEGRPDRKVHRVTASGRSELTRWLAEPTALSPLRDELAVKLRGAAYLDDLQPLAAQVEDHRAAHAERLDLYRQIEQRDFADSARLTGQALHQYLVLRGGIRVEQGLVEWCEEVLTALGAAR